MRQSNATPPNAESLPFIDLLKSAASVQVQELSPTHVKTQLENVWREFDSDDSNSQKAFLVTVRIPASPHAPSPTAAPEDNGPLPIDYLIQNAQLLLESKEYILARNLFSFVLQKNLKEPRALKGLGTCLSRLGQTAAAKKCFKALWEVHHHPEALFELGLCYISERQDDLALVYFKKIPLENALSTENKFELWKEMGNCQTRGGALVEAEKSYRRALQIIPSSDIIFVNLGTLNIQRGYFDEALDHFQQAIELNPKNAKAFCGIGLVAIQKGQNAAAAEAFHNALDLDALNVIALFQLLSLSDTLGSDAKIKNRLEAYLAQEPKNHEVRYALAVLLFKEGQWARCEKETDAILSLQRNHAKARSLKTELASTRHQLKL